MVNPPTVLTVVDTVYLSPNDSQPESVESHFSRDLKTFEQLYKRKLVVSEEWQKLDCGWLPNPSMIVISNLETGNKHSTPTEAEKLALSKKILEVFPTDSDVGWLVYPGESLRGTPSNVSSLRIRSQSGSIITAIQAFPN